MKNCILGLLLCISACQNRNNLHNYLATRTTAWPPEADEILKELATRYRVRPKLKKWADIAEEFNERIKENNIDFSPRDAKQCQERWTHHLDPNINHNPWTEEEDEQLLRLHKTHGNKWVDIAVFFQGRTNHDCKNRWYGKLAKRTKHRKVRYKDRKLSRALEKQQDETGPIVFDSVFFNDFFEL